MDDNIVHNLNSLLEIKIKANAKYLFNSFNQRINDLFSIYTKYSKENLYTDISSFTNKILSFYGEETDSGFEVSLKQSLQRINSYELYSFDDELRSDNVLLNILFLSFSNKIKSISIFLKKSQCDHCGKYGKAVSRKEKINLGYNFNMNSDKIITFNGTGFCNHSICFACLSRIIVLCTHGSCYMDDFLSMDKNKYQYINCNPLNTACDSSIKADFFLDYFQLPFKDKSSGCINCNSLYHNIYLFCCNCIVCKQCFRNESNLKIEYSSFDLTELKCVKCKSAMPCYYKQIIF